MRYDARIYFDKVVDEASVQSLLNKEFEMDEVVLNGVFEDRRGTLYASVSVSDDIPISILKMLGNRTISAVSAVKESKEMNKKIVIELPEDTEINGKTLKAGTRIQVQEKKELKEDHHMEIASDISKVRFDDGDPMDVEYIAQDIFDGIVNGVRMSRYISDSVKDDVLEQIGYLFDEMT